MSADPGPDVEYAADFDFGHDELPAGWDYWYTITLHRPDGWSDPQSAELWVLTAGEHSTVVDENGYELSTDPADFEEYSVTDEGDGCYRVRVKLADIDRYGSDEGPSGWGLEAGQ